MKSDDWNIGEVLDHIIRLEQAYKAAEDQGRYHELKERNESTEWWWGYHGELLKKQHIGG